MGLLQDKIAVVTGGGRGIGLGICEAFLREGAKKVIIADIVYGRAKETAEKLGPAAYAIKLDVTDKKNVTEVVDYIWDDIGAIDVWVNNAGIAGPESIDDTTEEIWDKLLDVNLKGVFLCSQAIFLKMRRKKSGKIVNIASIGGERGSQYAGIHYSSSKGGVLGLTKHLALKSAPYGITVNAITPGYIATEMSKATHTGDKQKLIDDVPLGRMGTPEDVANVSVFLASYLSDYVTGDTCRVNGGMYF